MKSRLLASILILALSFTFSHAEPESTQIVNDDIVIDSTEQYVFAGLSAGSLSNLNTKGVFGFRMGMQNNIWRTTFSYENNMDDYQSLFIKVDRTVIAGLFGNKGRIYLGLSGGAVEVTTEPNETVGNAYGGNVGFMLYLTDQLDVDIAYRYMKVDKLTMLTEMQGVIVSLHYFF